MGSPRIVEVVATLERGGAEVLVARLAGSLRARGRDVRVLALTRGGPLAATLDGLGVPWEVLGKRGRVDLGALWRLRRRLRGLGPAVVHSHMFTAGVYARLATVGLSEAVNVHTEHGMPPRGAPLQALFHWALARRAAVVTAPTRALARRLVALGVGARRVAVLPNAIDVAALDARLRVARAVASPATQRSRVVCVARLDPVKDHRTLLDAFARLGGAGRRAELRLVGDGPERVRIEAHRQRLPPEVAARVRLVGEVADVAPELARAAVFCLPSKSEGLSLAVLEAMAAELPVVASAIPGMDEVVEPGQSGLLVPPRDPPALADALAAVLGDPRLARSLGRRARARVLARFDWASAAGRWEGLLDEAWLGGPGRVDRSGYAP